MTKKFLWGLVCIFIIAACSANVFAQDGDIVCSSIRYFDANDNPVTSLSMEPITVKTEIIKNTTGKNPVIIVCSYENEMLNGVWYNYAMNPTGEISLTFTPVTIADGTVIKATVLESLETLGSPSVTARLLEDSTDLSRLTINGEILETYSDGVDVYQKLVSDDTKITIDAIPKDAGTKVEIKNNTTIPGVGQIKLTSPAGSQRDINIAFYSDVEQLSKPINIKYKIGDTSYDIPDFDPNVKDYTVSLPDNTFYVTVEPEVLSVTDTSVKVLDIDYSNKTFNGISYVSGTLSGSYKTTFNERPSVNNLIPIKNEATKAVIRTTYGDKSVKYTITFESIQPRLTSFNLNDEVKKSDKYHPIFIGGAAANNDNGTPANTDRAWTVVNISEQLLGSSMFVMDLRTNDIDQTGNGNKWYLETKQGEFFNFTADTAGTIYLLSRNGEIKNNEYDFANDDYNLAGDTFESDGKWRKLSYVAKEFIPQDYTDWKAIPRTYADIGDDIYYARLIQYSGKEKFDDDALTKHLGTLTSGPYHYSYVRTFEKDEKVSVYHRGVAGSNYIAFIKWDLD